MDRQVCDGVPKKPCLPCFAMTEISLPRWAT